eukprot:1179105-Prorocentrum_minimum.AAC.1
MRAPTLLTHLSMSELRSGEADAAVAGGGGAGGGARGECQRRPGLPHAQCAAQPPHRRGNVRRQALRGGALRGA